MTWKDNYDLLLINIWNVLLLVIIIPESPVAYFFQFIQQNTDLIFLGLLFLAIRVVLGIVGLLFIPGYLIISLLMPKKDDITIEGRFVSTIPLSILITVGISFILNFTVWGIRLSPFLLLFVGTNFCISIFCLAKRRSIHSDELFSPQIIYAINRPHFSRRIQKPKDLFYLIFIIVILILPLLIFNYSVFVKRSGNKYTEFYMVDNKNSGTRLLTSLNRGDTLEIRIIVYNHEYMSMVYNLTQKVNETNETSYSFTLQHTETFEKIFQTYAENSGPLNISFSLFDHEGLIGTLIHYITVT